MSGVLTVYEHPQRDYRLRAGDLPAVGTVWSWRYQHQESNRAGRPAGNGGSYDTFLHKMGQG